MSGFNIAILAGLFAAFANRVFGAQYGTAVAIAGVLGYTVLVGAGASVVRAAIMGSLALTAARLGRRSAGLNSLAAAAIGMTALNPLTLWDVGFQLSAGATLGLVLYADRLEAGFATLAGRFLPADRARRATEIAAEAFLLTTAAQLTTAPLIAGYFRQISVISLLANLVILPVQPVLMLAGGAAMLLGLVWLPLGQLAAWAAWPFSVFTIAFVGLFARVPGAALGLGDVTAWAVLAFYTLLFGLTWLGEKLPEIWKKLAAGWLPRAGLSLLTVAALIVWRWGFSLPETAGRLRVTVLDVGSGDAILVQAPSGAVTLIDGGPGGRRLARRLDEHLPLFTRRIDLLVVAATGDDSIGGAPDVLKRFTIGQALLTGAPGRSGAYRALREQLTALNVPLAWAAETPEVDLGDGVRLQVVWDGETGSALRLAWRDFALMLPVGADDAAESELLMHGLGLPAQALLVSGSGGAGATQAAWVDAVNPQLALIPVGAGDPLGRPAPEVLQRLAGRLVLRTDQHGSLTLITDGRQLWVETER